MASYARFYLRAKPITDEQYDLIDFFLHRYRPRFTNSTLTAEEGYWENLNDTWYNYVENMLDLSTKFPDVLFSVYCVGEDRDDVWTRYFKNGMTQRCPEYTLSWPLRPDKWAKMSESKYDHASTQSELRMDDVLNAVYQCMAVFLPECEKEWFWDTELLTQAVRHMADFMVQHGLTVDIPSFQQHSDTPPICGDTGRGGTPC